MARKKLRYAKAFEDYHVVDPKYVHRDRFGHFTGPAIEKLAEYEATGMTPGQVSLIQKEVQALRNKCGLLESQVGTLEDELLLAKCDREYFRSRATFLREVMESG